MDRSDARSLRPLLDRTRRRAPLSEVLSLKAFSMRRILRMMQRAVQNGCISACKFMCLPLDSLLFDRFICYSAQLQQPVEDRAERAALQSPPPTILIVNSTLINCVIGHEASLSAVANRQPLMMHPHCCLHGQGTDSCTSEHQGAEESSPPPPPPPLPPPSCSPPPEEQLMISIQGSHLNYVIIGNNNYLHAEEGVSLD